MSQPPPRTTLEQWAALVAVTDEGGFEPAADALRRSQSSVSYTLKRLQEQLPIAILTPQGRRTRLTPQGELVLQRARAILAEAHRLERFAETLAQGWEPEVRLAVEIVTPPSLLMGALARFAERSPQTRVQLIEAVLSGTSEALLQRHADLAITGMVPPGFLGDPLVRVELIAVAHPAHALMQLDRTLTLADLKQHRQVVIRDSGHYRQIDSGWLGADERWTVSHLTTAIAIIQRGLAFAWVPKDSVSAALSSGDLAELPLEHGGTRAETLYLVYADAADAGPATRALARILAEHAQATVSQAG